MELILDAIQDICHQAGILTERHGIPSVTKPNGKTGRGDLVLKNVDLGGHRHLIIDVAVHHSFGGNHMADVSRNGELRDADPDQLLEASARRKVRRYREAWLDSAAHH